jgi:ABC-type phosphate transport system substrate-binding protein
MTSKLSTGMLLAALCLSAPAQAQVKVDPKLPAYKEVEGVSGRIKSVGSDTMNNLMAKWGEGFKKFYPSIEMAVEGKGSGTAPPALIDGTSTFGPMSREMTNKEIASFKAKFGYAPTAVRSSIDMLAVFVHKDNPIEGLTLARPATRRSAPGATWASRASGPTSRSASTAATRPPEPTSTSRSTLSATATTRRRSRNSQVAPE